MADPDHRKIRLVAPTIDFLSRDQAVEEIILSTPGDKRPHDSAEDDLTPEASLRLRLQSEFLRHLKRRDRLVVTPRGDRRQEEFAAALKNLVKQAATDICRPIPERQSRHQVRVRAYAGLMEMSTLLTHDRDALVARLRTARRQCLILVLTTVAAITLLALTRIQIMN